MTIIARGLGWLAPVVAFAALMLCQFAVDAIHGDGFYTANTWPKQLAISIAAFSVFVFGLCLNHVWRGIATDPVTGESIGKAPSHTLFFIPVEYWSIAVLATLLLYLE